LRGSLGNSPPQGVGPSGCTGGFNTQVASQGTWTAIIPIRSFTEGKTRLRIPQAKTSSLIQAFADDVIHACSTCPEISRTVVVTPDPKVLALAQDRGCEILHEEGATGINEAIDVARTNIEGPVIAILGDIPSLTGEILTMVLQEARAYRTSFVADAAGVGSTMWCVQPPSSATSHFGHHSRAEHRSHGAVELGSGNASPAWARARRDVDTDIDLWDAIRLGLGPASSELLG
jgi:2-phospho-L-lactate/phosphoenolpyruvate guanylyltransferase